MLIEGKKIAAIAPELKAADAQVIDARDTIIVPGFVDSHRHSWEGQLRRINPNSPTLADYSNATHQSFAKAYRPEDMYVGNYLTAVGCIDAGITCVIDNSHNARTAAHSDAAVEALMDSGVRAVHASGAPQAGDWNKQWPADLERLQKKYFSSADQLVTLRMFSGPNRDNWAAARKLGLRITSEFTGERMAAMVEPMWVDKLVGPDNTFNHCGGLPETTWKMFVDSGASINVCPRSDAQYGLGEGVCALQRAWDHGIKPGLSVDNETSYSTDMFAEMRVALYLQRAFAQNRKFSGDQNAPKPLMIRDVLYCATMAGADCAGLDDKIGSLDAGQGGRSHRDPRRRHQSLPFEQRHRHRRAGGRTQQCRNRDHRRTRPQISRQGARARHEASQGDGRGIARPSFQNRGLPVRTSSRSCCRSWAKRRSPSNRGKADMAGLLAGVRVLDLTNVLAGPFCCYQLAQLGAEVIKVETPGTGDLARQLGADPELNRRLMGASFLAQNAGKRSITLNLKKPKAREAFARLVNTADVVVENFRPGVMDRLGLGYDG